MQAIQTATGWAAECIGLAKETGTVEKGKQADLLVIDGDPLANIGVLRDKNAIKLVMKGGRSCIDKLPAASPVPMWRTSRPGVRSHEIVAWRRED